MPATAEPTTSRLWLMGLGMVLMGTAVWFAPPHMVAKCRGVFLDILRPGLQAAQYVEQEIHERQLTWQSEQVQRLSRELAAAQSAEAQSEARVRRLSVLLADQSESHATEQSSADQVPPLFTPALITGHVLGTSLSEAWRKGVVFDRGWPSGVREAALVIQSHAPLIDLGEPDQISPEDPLLMGRVVLGKVAVVGRWTSTYLPVTDQEFRGPAQLLHASSTGAVWGAKGVLKGNGQGCELQGLSSAMTVRIGDDVYTADRDGLLDAPLYYGKVTTAELTNDGREWIVIVEPASRPSSLTQVQVLRAALNPQRILTN
ncbi:hypothetical protein GC163_10770 [bacterium]|nr:hypothetical protein [bacterium]